MNLLPPLLFEAEVVERRDYGCASEVVFRVPGAFSPRPGQFVHLLCDGEGRIMRRPYSVFRLAGEKASVLVREVGGGSAWLRRRKSGDRLDILGPLGRGFLPPKEGEEPILVAGGTGIAPLAFLGRWLQGMGWRTRVLWGMEGGMDYGDLPDRLAEELDLRVATADGSRGIRGTALDLLPAGKPTRPTRIYACGPRSMLLTLVELLGEGGLCSLQVSVEERMACGVGACRGCAVPVVEPPGGYRAACRDGPVFGGEELDWERLRGST
ncbi:MAG: iron-sulfur cluster-binding protein [Actinomycetota bacterium]